MPPGSERLGGTMSKLSERSFHYELALHAGIWKISFSQDPVHGGLLMKCRTAFIIISLLNLSIFAFFLIPSFLFAAPGITGTYQGKLSYKEGVSFGPVGFCYSKTQAPTLDFTLKKVKVRGKVVSGKYDNGEAGGTEAKGKRNSKGFKVSIRYGRQITSYKYYYVYTIVVSGIKASKAQVTMSGITYLGESVTDSGCRYKYSGTVKHK